MGRRLELEVQWGEEVASRHEVPVTGLRLGRASTNDIHFPDEELSRIHCLFERNGEDGVSVVDLSSANGTYVNGEPLGADLRVLKAGDRVTAGGVSVEVVGEAAAAAASAAPKGGGAHLLAWCAAVALAAVAAFLFLPVPFPRGAVEKPDEPPAEPPAVRIDSFSFEKIEADTSRVFRVSLTLENGSIRVACDDVPDEDRHVALSLELAPDVRARIEKILSAPGWDADGRSLRSVGTSGRYSLRRLRTVSGGRVRSVCVENGMPTAAFEAVCKELAAFMKEAFGLWALHYSGDELRTMGKTSAAVADRQWEERDHAPGNLAAAVRSYRRAVFCVETLRAKPEAYAHWVRRLADAEAELDERCARKNFLVDRAIHTGDWETARREVAELLAIVPDAADPRHEAAKKKAVSVESRTKAAPGGRSNR